MAVPLFPIISSVQSKEALDRPCYGVYQTCFEVVVFGSHGPAFVFTGYEAEYRVCDAGALRAEPLAPFILRGPKNGPRRVHTHIHTRGACVGDRSWCAVSVTVCRVRVSRVCSG